MRETDEFTTRARTRSRAGQVPAAPGVEPGSFGRFSSVLRERWKLILTVTLLTTAAAVAYVALAPKVYEAEADLLVTPISRDNDALVGLGLLRESSDPTRDVETVARLVPTLPVERRATTKVPRALRDELRDVRADPIAQSSIVSVIVDAGSPAAAVAWANAYADAFIEVRTQAMRRRATAEVRSLQGRLRATSNQAVQDELALQLTQLQRVQEGTDPTLELETRAVPPEGAVSPRPALSIIAALLVGLILGTGGALALQGIDSRLRREDQLQDVYPLPVLARISLSADRRRSRRRGGRDRADDGVDGRRQLSPAAIEAYWGLRTMLAPGYGSNGSQAITVTSPSTAEDKSSVALDFAHSLALAGERVILIEGDLRRPTIARAIGASPPRTTEDVVMGIASLDEALVSSSWFPESLQLVLASDTDKGETAAEGALVINAQRLVEDARDLADYIIIDAPPLAEGVGGLPLAESADEILLVVRVGRTSLSRLDRVRHLLSRHPVQPAGFAVIRP